MVFCTEFLDSGGLDSRCVGRVYGADGALLTQMRGCTTQVPPHPVKVQ